MIDTNRPTLALISGRTVGAAATFLLPLVLVRVFSPADFGTYRELFLIFTTVYLLGQFGLFETLYYFVPGRETTSAPFVANTVIVKYTESSLDMLSLNQSGDDTPMT